MDNVIEKKIEEFVIPCVSYWAVIVLTLIMSILTLNIIFFTDYSFIPEIMFALVMVPVMIYFTTAMVYISSCTYELRKDGINIKPFFGLQKDKFYPFINLRKIEKPNGGRSLILYFEDGKSFKKIRLNSPNKEPFKVDNFIIENVENVDKLLAKIKIKWGVIIFNLFIVAILLTLKPYLMKKNVKKQDNLLVNIKNKNN